MKSKKKDSNARYKHKQVHDMITLSLQCIGVWCIEMFAEGQNKYVVVKWYCVMWITSNFVKTLKIYQSFYALAAMHLSRNISM